MTASTAFEHLAQKRLELRRVVRATSRSDLPTRSSAGTPRIAASGSFTRTCRSCSSRNANPAGAFEEEGVEHAAVSPGPLRRGDQAVAHRASDDRRRHERPGAQDPGAAASSGGVVEASTAAHSAAAAATCMSACVRMKKNET